MSTPSIGHIGHHILLALSLSELHGYAIMKQVEHDTSGDLHLGPASLYTNIRRLLEQGYIEETTEKVDASLDDSRRRYYRISAQGAHALQEEIMRHQRFLSVASLRCTA